ncbi:MAG: hypothetical protein ACYSR0_00390 [Planctomycetota bacterium]|jgi:hypothetical protein
MDISVNFSGSILYPEKITYTSGLSLMYLFTESARFGIVFNPIKVKCDECNTPVAEIAGGSIIIKNRHHGSKHTTTIAVDDLNNLI